MYGSRCVRVLLSVVALVLAAWPAATAYADPPTFEVISVYEEFYFAAGVPCAFPIQGVTTGTLRIQHHYDRNGNLIFDNIVFAQWTNRVTNPLNGESLFSAGPDAAKITYNPDGSILLTYSGLIVNAIERGEGQIATATGRITFLITFDEEGGVHEEVIFEAGLHEVDVAQAACDALAE
jgi:hypothetical protein